MCKDFGSRHDRAHLGARQRRQPTLVDARRHVLRAVHGDARQHGRERRAAVDPAQPVDHLQRVPARGARQGDRHVAGVSALALAIGPVVGGFLVENVSWQSIFFLNLPVAVLAVIVTVAAAPESRDETVERFVDVPGVAALSVGLATLVLALVEGNSWGWGSAPIVALFAAAAGGLA